MGGNRSQENMFLSVSHLSAFPLYLSLATALGIFSLYNL